MKNKINSRLIGLSVFSIIITALLITIVYYTNFRQQVEKDLSLTAHVLASNDFVNDEIDLSFVKNEIRVTWIDTDGSVIYDNDVDNAALDNHLNRQEVSDAFKYGEGKCIRTSDTLNLSTYYFALKLSDGTVLRVAKDAQSITAIFLHTVPYTLIIMIVVAFACLLISNLLTRQLVRPINDLADNLDSPNLSVPYKELVPITDKIRKQHADILSASQMRQEFTDNVHHRCLLHAQHPDKHEKCDRSNQWIYPRKDGRNAHFKGCRRSPGNGQHRAYAQHHQRRQQHSGYPPNAAGNSFDIAVTFQHGQDGQHRQSNICDVVADKGRHPHRRCRHSKIRRKDHIPGTEKHRKQRKTNNPLVFSLTHFTLSSLISVTGPNLR